LRRAIQLGNENRPWFERNPQWDALRDDPEYQQILNSINVPVREEAGH
jgi:hypothetical protein